MRYCGIPVPGEVGAALDFAYIASPVPPTEEEREWLGQKIHEELIDAWVNALVKGEDRLTVEDMALVEKEWELSGSIMREAVVRRDGLNIKWVEDHTGLIARYIRPTAQDFWLRVDNG